MADTSDIRQVRRNTDEPTEDSYTDLDINSLVDELGVAGASARIWRDKSAKAASLVDTTEAGSSLKLSQLSKTYAEQAAYWEQAALPVAPDLSGFTKVKKIERRSR